MVSLPRAPADSRRGTFTTGGCFNRNLDNSSRTRMAAGKGDRHILIVEDDSDLVIVLVQVLEQEGYRVSAASRRVEALAVLGQGDVDLIVADSVLRGGNGDDIA